VKEIQVTLIDLSLEFGPWSPQGCCLINNRTLRRYLDANDKVTRLPYKLIIIIIIIIIMWRFGIVVNALVVINEVTLRRVRLVLRWV